MKDKRNTQQVVDRITEIRQELCTSIQNKGVVCPPETKFQDLHLKIDEIQQAKINAEEVEAYAIGSFKEGDVVMSHRRFRSMEEIGSTYDTETGEGNIVNMSAYVDNYIFRSTNGDIQAYKMDEETNQIKKLATITHEDTRTYKIIVLRNDEINKIRILGVYINSCFCFTFNTETNEFTKSHEKALDDPIETIQAIAKHPSKNTGYVLTTKGAYTISFDNGFTLRKFYTHSQSNQNQSYQISASEKYIALQTSALKLLTFTTASTIPLLEVDFKSTAHKIVLTTDNFIILSNSSEQKILFFKNILSNSPIDTVRYTNIKEITPVDNYSFIGKRNDGFFYLYYMNENSIRLDSMKMTDRTKGKPFMMGNKLVFLPPTNASDKNLFHFKKRRIIFDPISSEIENCSTGIVKKDISNRTTGTIYLTSRCLDDSKKQEQEEEGV